MNNKKGKTAIKKLNAIPPALVVKAPLTIPIMYISITSYKDIPSKPGILIFFPNITNRFTIGIFSNLSSISFVIFCSYIVKFSIKATKFNSVLILYFL